MEYNLSAVYSDSGACGSACPLLWFPVHTANHWYIVFASILMCDQVLLTLADTVKVSSTRDAGSVSASDKHKGRRKCVRGEIADANDLFILLKDKVNPKDLGHCLKLPYQTMEDLDDEKRKTSHLLRALLDKWFRGSDPPVCWEDIIAAVRCTGDNRLASELEEQHP